MIDNLKQWKNRLNFFPSKKKKKKRNALPKEFNVSVFFALISTITKYKACRKTHSEPSKKRDAKKRKQTQKKKQINAKNASWFFFLTENLLLCVK